MANESSDLTRTGITIWDFGDLPGVVETGGTTHTVRAYPALVDHDDSVAIELLPTADEQAEAMWLGARRLLRLQLSAPVRTLDRMLDDDVKLAMTVNPIQSRAQWYNDTIDCALDDLIAHHGGPPRTQGGFAQLVATATDALVDRLDDLVPVLAEAVPLSGRIHDRLDEMAGFASLEVSVADARAHFQRLAYPGLIAGIGFDHVVDLPRYLEALAFRLDRLPENGQADLLKAAEVVNVEQRHRTAVERFGLTEALEALLWQLEELRVATFAQHLRPTGPDAVKVSARKVERALIRLETRS